MLQASDKTDSRQPEYRPLRYDIIALNPTAGDVGYGAISTELGCPGHVRFTGLSLLLASGISTSAISPGSI
jgi:hypothetical protein